MKRRGAGTITSGDVGQRVLLQAWVQRRRDHGGLIFFDLRDRSGVVQVVLRSRRPAGRGAGPGRGPQRVGGGGRGRGDPAAAPSTSTPSCPRARSRCVAERAAVLSRSEPLPFTLDGKAEACRGRCGCATASSTCAAPSCRSNFVLRDRVTHEVRNYFHDARLPRRRDADPHQARPRRGARLPGALAASSAAASTPCRSRRSSSSSS